MTASVPIILPDYCRSETASLSDVTWAFGTYLGALEKEGIGWHQFPDDLREIGTLNTACGGLLSNGARTSLRNLVVIEGLEFTRAFLKTADAGASRLKWFFHASPFLAELEWLDMVGNDAAGRLEDYDTPILLLDAAYALFNRVLDVNEHGREILFEGIDDDLKSRFAQAEANERNGATEHSMRLYLFIMAHPNLEFVVVDKDLEEPMALYNARLKDCAAAIKKAPSFLDRVPILNRLRDRNKLN